MGTAAVVISILAAVLAVAAAWCSFRAAAAARTATAAAARSEQANRELLDIQRAEIYRRDTPRFLLTMTRPNSDGMRTTFRVQLIDGPDLGSVIAKLKLSALDTRAVYGLARASDDAARTEAEIGPVTKTREGQLCVTIGEPPPFRVPITLVCTEEGAQPRVWTVHDVLDVGRAQVAGELTRR